MDKSQRMLLEKESNSRAYTAERRRESRTLIARPVYIRQADPSERSFEETQITTDFSNVGLHFVTTQRNFYRKGMKLYVIPVLGCLNFEYLGEVMRMERQLDGRYGIGVKLLHIGKPVLDSRRVGSSALGAPDFLRLAETWVEVSPAPTPRTQTRESDEDSWIEVPVSV